MVVREAQSNELSSVMNVLDGAYLDIQTHVVQGAIQSGSVFVFSESDRIVGVLVIRSDPDWCPQLQSQTHASVHVEAVAVRRKRRNQGIGRALIGNILARYGSATVTFNEGVKPFYETLGVSILSARNKTYYGVLEADDNQEVN